MASSYYVAVVPDVRHTSRRFSQILRSPAHWCPLGTSPVSPADKEQNLTLRPSSWGATRSVAGRQRRGWCRSFLRNLPCQSSGPTYALYRTLGAGQGDVLRPEGGCWCSHRFG